MITGNTRDYFFDNILPKNAICAEIGVRTGVNSDRILRLINPKKLYLIDCWDWTLNKRENNPTYNNILEEYYKGINMEEWYGIVKEKYKNIKNIEIIRDLSISAAKKFEDNYFDWVYIDASHDCLSVQEDINVWFPKIKQDGFLCGHDYYEPWDEIPSVKVAVDDFIKKNKLELFYFNIKEERGVDGASDWAIKKY